MSKGIFITATGTDIGKTFVSALLVKKMRDLGFNCGYYKPVLSGALVKDGALWAGDCEYVKKIANLKGSATDFASYIFEPAVSPHLAAEMANITIDIDKIRTDYEKARNQYQYVVVEGAGGIVCPLCLKNNNIILLKDIVKKLDLAIVIVASAALGTINSVVLTVEYAKANNIAIKGIILNNYDENDFMQRDNLTQIEKLTNCKVICKVKPNDLALDIEKENLLKVFEV